MEHAAEVNSIAERKESDAAALEKLIAQRAQELYELRGREEGHALEDWLRAEGEVRAKLGTQGKLSDQVSGAGSVRIPTAAGLTAAFFKIRVGDVIYTLQYDPQHCDAYRPGMLKKGQPVELRFEEDKVYMKLPNARELEAKVVRKGQASKPR